MDDCQSFSSKPKWMERECQSLMCLMARRDIEREIKNHAFLEDNYLTIFVKSFEIQSNVWRSFPN